MHLRLCYGLFTSNTTHKCPINHLRGLSGKQGCILNINETQDYFSSGLINHLKMLSAWVLCACLLLHVRPWGWFAFLKPQTSAPMATGSVLEVCGSSFNPRRKKHRRKTEEFKFRNMLLFLNPIKPIVEVPNFRCRVRLLNQMGTSLLTQV